MIVGEVKDCWKPMSWKPKVKVQNQNRYAQNALQQNQLTHTMGLHRNIKRRCRVDTLSQANPPEWVRAKHFRAIMIIIILFIRAQWKSCPWHKAFRRYTQVWRSCCIATSSHCTAGCRHGQTTTNESLTRLDFDSTWLAEKKSFAFQPSLSLDERGFDFLNFWKKKMLETEIEWTSRIPNPCDVIAAVICHVIMLVREAATNGDCCFCCFLFSES